MIFIFDKNECEEISNGIIRPEHVQKANSVVVQYLRTNGVELTDTTKLKLVINKTSTDAAKQWHCDDVTIINLIINIKGEGTYVFIHDEIRQIPEGVGCIMVGEQGYHYLGLLPVLHRAPAHDTERTLMKIILAPGFNSDEYLVGPDVCKYDSDKYIYRKEHLTHLIETGIEQVNSLSLVVL